MSGDICDFSKAICFVCEKQFRSKMSLWMHLSRAKVHRRGTPEYHGEHPYEEYKVILPNNQKTLEEYF